MPIKSKRVDEETMAVLKRLRVVKDRVFIPGGDKPESRLKPHLYKKVDSILRTLGGQWNKKEQAHIFTINPENALQEIVQSGAFDRFDKKKEESFFPTPPELAVKLVALANIDRGMTVLEPSAGRGALVKPLIEVGAKVTCVEINPTYESDLRALGVRDIVIGDFLDYSPERNFDRVVMNPPFSANNVAVDISHVVLAYQCLKPRGVLVAVTASSWTFRQTKAHVEFKGLVDAYGESFANPEGSFREAGTNVNTMTVILHRPRT